MKNLLFITWDGPQTSYMEGLFMPIFQEIAKKENIKFHVLQFTWADEKKIALTKSTAEKMGIQYTALPILRKPNLSVGGLLTVFTSSNKIKKYIREHQIDIVMPRSTFPAMMLNQIKNRNFKLLFDADGLPIEERIDFAGLKKNSFQYKLMKSAEMKMLKKADAVITRSEKSIDTHISVLGEGLRKKFSVVFNGRDSEFFKNSSVSRTKARENLNVQSDELLFVYCGSLGAQYCWEEMMLIFNAYKKNAKAKFLILTGNTEFANAHILPQDKKYIIVKSVAFTDVPFWLNVGDVAFALRKPTYSMQGVSPIKLGEYLLMNLPTIASKGIGDTEKILKNFEDCFLYDHAIAENLQLPKILSWLDKTKNSKNIDTRTAALKYFSLKAAAQSYQDALSKIDSN